MQYITDYEDYQSIGGVLDATAFDRFYVRENNVVNIATHFRIKAENTEAINAAKYAERDIIEYIARNNDVEITSKSQSVGGISESESYKTKDKEEQEMDIDQILFDYLGGLFADNIPLLYRGGL